MHTKMEYPTDKKELYHLLAMQIDGLIGVDKFMISSLSNIAAVLWDTMPDLNWVGFYLRNQDTLFLGPFQGKLACVEIAMGKGVCGACLLEDKTQRIEDVHAFPGHIACDADSNSELVIPIHYNGAVVAVLDIDSPCKGRFTEEDQVGLEKLVNLIEKNWHKPLF